MGLLFSTNVERNTLNPNLHELFVLGIPELQFIRDVTAQSTKHTSAHIGVTSKKCISFNILNEYQSKNFTYQNQKLLKANSCFLSYSDIVDRKVHFVSEPGIHSILVMLFGDIKRLLGGNITIVQECSITNEKGSRNSSHRADFWVVYQDCRPLLAIEFKSPPEDLLNGGNKKMRLDSQPAVLDVIDGADYGVAEETAADKDDEENDDEDDEFNASLGEAVDDVGTNDVPEGAAILDDDKVLGQVFDYQKTFQQFYGMSEVLALVTTLKHFRVVGLPGCEDLAAAVDVTTPRADPPAAAMSTKARSVCVSRVYDHHDPTLIPMLLSLIRKAQHAKHRNAVPLFDNKRLYVVLSSQSWCWTRPKHSLAAAWRESFTCVPSAPLTGVSGFVVLRPLHLMAKRKVWLTMVKSPAPLMGTLCVVKQVESGSEVVEKELWEKVNLCAEAAVCTVCRMRAIVSRFVILARVSANDSGVQSVSFDFDPSRWLFPQHSPFNAADIPPACYQFAEQMKRLAMTKGILNPNTAAVEAIHRMAEAGYCHNDLEWRHVALIPEHAEGSTEVTGVHAGLIDFEDAVQTDPETALTNMSKKLIKIRGNVTFVV